MKRTLVAVSIAALSTVGLAGTASAAPSDAACFGQVHKTINTEGALTVEDKTDRRRDVADVAASGPARAFHDRGVSTDP